MRIALGVEYDGQSFSGRQMQANLLTVQGCLQDALSQIADEPIQVYCAGRTDAGVHASGQVVHFDTRAQRDLRDWTLGTNSRLPATIAVKWAKEVAETFHARFSAISRRYQYTIYNQPTRPAIGAAYLTWYRHPLDAARMQQAGQYLLGEQDFSSFRSSECESRTPMRNVHFLNVSRQGDKVMIDIQANAFLHHMVRNIVGVLLRIGAGLAEPEWALAVLKAKDRRQAAETAPAAGLCLVEVGY